MDITPDQLAQAADDHTRAVELQTKLLWDMSESWRAMAAQHQQAIDAHQGLQEALNAICERLRELGDGLAGTLELYRGLCERLDYLNSRLDAAEGDR